MTPFYDFAVVYRLVKVDKIWRDGRSIAASECHLKPEGLFIAEEYDIRTSDDPVSAWLLFDYEDDLLGVIRAYERTRCGPIETKFAQLRRTAPFQDYAVLLWNAERCMVDLGVVLNSFYWRVSFIHSELTQIVPLNGLARQLVEDGLQRRADVVYLVCGYSSDEG